MNINYEKEEWKDIENYEGLYEISSLGRVKRTFKKSFNFLKPQYNRYGYQIYSLTKQGKTKKHTTHRLIAKAFIPNPLNKPEVNHIDGNKKNNNIKNLEWATSSENRIHAYKNGLNKKYYGKKHWNYNKRGDKHPQSRKVAQYNLNGNLIRIWDSFGEVYRKTKISSGNIYMVCNKKRKTAGGYIWKYLEANNE